VARELAGTVPLEQISFSEIARIAKVSWPTVRRYLGSRERLHAFLQRENLDRVPKARGTRDLVLDSAGRVFARKGYAAATLEDVGAEAGMTKGAVYWHFGSKADVFYALVQSRAAEQLNGMPERVEAALAMEDPREGLSRILALQLAAIKSDPVFPRLFLEFVGESRNPAVRERVSEVYRHSHSFTADLTHALRAQGRLSERADPEAFAMMWSALLDGLLLLSLVDPDRIRPETLAPQLVELIWHGLKRRHGNI
jgi:TetR/AcrR family acrAB operon transcriptional repressor